MADLTAPILQKSSGVATLHRFLLFRPPVTLLTRSSFPAGFLAERAEVLGAEDFGVVEGSSRRFPCTDCFTEATAARLPLGWGAAAWLFFPFAWRGVDARSGAGAASSVLLDLRRRSDALAAVGSGVVSRALF